jgi:hypothetical protein
VNEKLDHFDLLNAISTNKSSLADTFESINLNFFSSRLVPRLLGCSEEPKSHHSTSNHIDIWYHSLEALHTSLNMSLLASKTVEQRSVDIECDVIMATADVNGTINRSIKWDG